MERARAWRSEWVIIGLVFLAACCLGPPLLLGARERNRQMACGNHLKELTLALQNYHDTFLYLPYGARARTVDDESSMGPSWLVAAMPFYDPQQPTYDKLVACDVASPDHDYGNVAMLKVVHEQKLALFHCPASPMPEMEKVNGSLLMLPSYVGLMGADPRQRESEELHIATGEHGFSENRIARGVSNGDHLGFGGMLTVNESLTMAACTDGAANMLLLGETSRWYEQGGNQHRVDGAAGGSWLAGTACPVAAGESKDFPGVAFNLTTIRYPVNIDRQPGTVPAISEGNTGIASDHGANNPLLSPHANGVMMAYLDGHVQLISNSVSIITLKRIATRDDGGVICTEDDDEIVKPNSAGVTVPSVQKSSPVY
jgi:prepilin-type processing-associated H-X9-DG protein